MYGFYPHGIHNPFIKEIKSDENNTLVFDGYFYIDSKDLPVQRIMVKFGEESIDENRNTYRVKCSDMHIEIYEKISGEDTSFYSKSDQINISDDIIIPIPIFRRYYVDSYSEIGEPIVIPINRNF